MCKNLFVSSCALVALLGVAVQAAQIPVTNTLTNTTWVGLDNSDLGSLNDDDPITTVDQTTLPPFIFNAAPNVFTVGENNFGATHTAGQSFLATKGGRVGNVQMYIGGAPSLEYDVHLYNQGTPAFPINPGPYSTATDLLPADTWFRFNGAQNNAVVVLDLIAAGLNNISLTPGNTYVWEIVGHSRDDNGVPDGGSNPSELTWVRNGANNSFIPFGQAFRERTPINGNNDRSFAMAVHMVPEPASIALIGLALVGIGSLNRRSR